MTNSQPVALAMLYTLFKANFALLMVTVSTLVAGGVLIVSRDSNSHIIVGLVIALWAVTVFACVGLFFHWQHQFRKLSASDPDETARFEKETATAKRFRELRVALRQTDNERVQNEAS